MNSAHTAKNQTPSLDVVIYVHNHENFIEQTLRSVFEQKVDADVTIRVHDDASTDGTQSVLERLKKESPFRMVITRPSQNRYQDGSGFKHEFLVDSRADFLAVLDGDDYWSDPSKLQRQLEVLMRNPQVSLCHHAYEVRRGEKLVETARAKSESLVPGTEFSQGNFVGTSSVMLRRSAVPKVLPDGFNKVRGVDDWPIWALTTQHSMVAYLDRPMAVYRLHEENYFANQDLATKKFQSLIAMVYITNSLDPEHQALWLAALEAKMVKKISLTGRLVTFKSRLFGSRA
jgi:glycosyltransferase involved in cell wall biosynthesis